MKNEMLTKKEHELKVLQSSFKDSCVGYISEDESDLEEIENELVSKHCSYKNNDTCEMCKTCEKLRLAKETAENEAKEKAKSLSEAKMIISSLEQSNKNMTENLKSRLHDSNAAIVSLLEQSKLHEKESAEFKKQLKKYEVEKELLKAKLIEPRNGIVVGVEGNTSLTKISSENESLTGDNYIASA
jgi:phosphatidate phosphatase PAH1